MLSGATVLIGILTGVAAGLQFNPLFAAVTAALAAALSGFRRAPRTRVWISAVVVVAGWVVGDGIRIAATSGATAYLAAWALTGLAVGYGLPAFAGAYVGRQVHKGTGYLSAAAVAVMLVGALSVLSDPLASALMRIAS